MKNRRDKDRLQAALTAAFAIAAFSLHGATTLYVKPGGTGSGTSWSDAADLEAAVATATAAGGEYHIYLAQGMYYPAATVKLSDGISGVSIYGSFPGLSDDETLESRSVENTPSIISGDKNKTAYWQKADGTAVKDGSGNTLRVFDDGVFNEPNPTKEDFYWRPVATRPVATLFDAQTARADEGAGMQLVFDGVTFAVGAVDVGRAESTFRNCRFLACQNGAGKVVLNSWTNLVLSGMSFVGNFGLPVSDGGAKIERSTCKWVVTNCVFKANVGGNDRRGPGLSPLEADIDVVDTEFRKNATDWQGTYYGSLVAVSDYTKSRLIGCVFAENAFSNTPAILSFPYRAKGVASNCLFVANRVFGDIGSSSKASYGAIVYSNSGGAILYNTTFLSNEVDFARTEVKAGSTNGYASVVFGTASVGLVNCHLEGNRTRYAGPEGQEDFHAHSCTVYQGGGNKWFPFVGTSFFENDFLDGEVFVYRQSTSYGLYFINSVFWGTRAGYTPLAWKNTTQNYLDFYNCIIKNAPAAGGTGSTGVVHEYVSCYNADPQFGELVERDGRFYRQIGRHGGARCAGAPVGVATDGVLCFLKANGNWYQCAQPWASATFTDYFGDMYGDLPRKPERPDLGPVQSAVPPCGMTIEFY